MRASASSSRSCSSSTAVCSTAIQGRSGQSAAASASRFSAVSKSRKPVATVAESASQSARTSIGAGLGSSLSRMKRQAAKGPRSESIARAR